MIKQTGEVYYRDPDTNEIDKCTVHDLREGVSGGIEDAPKDSTEYLRKDGAWVHPSIPELLDVTREDATLAQDLDANTHSINALQNVQFINNCRIQPKDSGIDFFMTSDTKPSFQMESGDSGSRSLITSPEFYTDRLSFGHGTEQPRDHTSFQIERHVDGDRELLKFERPVDEKVAGMMSSDKGWEGQVQGIDIPSKSDTEQTKFLRGDGAWANVPSEDTQNLATVLERGNLATTGIDMQDHSIENVNRIKFRHEDTHGEITHMTDSETLAFTCNDKFCGSVSPTHGFGGKLNGINIPAKSENQSPAIYLASDGKYRDKRFGEACRALSVTQLLNDIHSLGKAGDWFYAIQTEELNGLPIGNYYVRYKEFEPYVWFLEAVTDGTNADTAFDTYITDLAANFQWKKVN